MAAYNHLKDEKSPYLLQHAQNPVDWYPWGEEAFAKARQEDRPVFLSIGYSTCHWCHVMAHESFEDQEVARLLNSGFISIKVDREERPDIDAVYMAVCQALTGSGGWPLTILMTPDRKPFYAGTYFPKASRYAMPGLTDLLESIADQWENNREELINSGEQIAGAVAGRKERNRAVQPKKEQFRRAAVQFAQRYDETYGGFGRSPKFPSPHNLMFLLRTYEAEGSEQALEMTETTLRQMYRGGIFDHVGFGFSRYSTDEKWLVPHFEKMLYDNALLAMAYTEAYQATGNGLYRSVCEKILRYITREMTDLSGGFYSAQDADSDGEEGKYYLISPEEILRLLGEDDGQYFNQYFDITSRGNFEGKNIPNLIGNSDYAKPDSRIEAMLPKVYEYRLGRTALHKDDKILTAWNGLMTAAFAKAYRAFGDKEYLSAAQSAMTFVTENLMDGAGHLSVRWRDGNAAGTGNLEDYSFTVWALLELYAADYNPKYLELALKLNQTMLSEFLDEENGGFFLSAKSAEQLIFRPKEVYDGAIPSGNSVAGYCLRQLAELTGSTDLEEAADRQLKFLAGVVSSYESEYAFALIAQMSALYPAMELVALVENDADLEGLRQLLRARFLPNLTVLVISPQWKEQMHTLAGFTKEYALKDNKSTYYVCRNHACMQPVTDLPALRKILFE